MKLTKIKTFINTVKYLKFRQIIYRIFYRVKSINVPAVGNSSIPTNQWKWDGPKITNQSIFEDYSVLFLRQWGSVSNPASWNEDSKELLWLYNLHYFDDLNSENSSLRISLHKRLILRWVDENPACHGLGWEPYPLSLRIVNLIKWYTREEVQDTIILNSIIQQSQALFKQIEYHILGNHLFANAKALIFSGSFINNELGIKYLNKGLKIINQELKEEFLEDGGHFERSPMYHSILLFDLLELIDLAGVTSNQKLIIHLDKWKAIASKALMWLKTMLHPDGEISFFNDSAFDIAVPPSEIFNYAKKLGLNVVENKNKLINLSASGYTRIATDNYSMLIDHAKIGPDYLPGHAHADTLSFELSLMAQRVFVNSGTSLYGISDERHRQRSTKSHNTVEINGCNSSEVWGGFRVAQRANSKLESCEVNNEKIVLTASHDGYKRLPGRPVHRRTFIASNNLLEIVDFIEGKFINANCYFYLHPDINVIKLEKNCVNLILPDGKRLYMNSTMPINILSSTWHPKFGMSVSNKLLKISFNNSQVVHKLLFD